MKRSSLAIDEILSNTRWCQFVSLAHLAQSSRALVPCECAILEMKRCLIFGDASHYRFYLDRNLLGEEYSSWNSPVARCFYCRNTIRFASTICSLDLECPLEEVHFRRSRRYSWREISSTLEESLCLKWELISVTIQHGDDHSSREYRTKPINHSVGIEIGVAASGATRSKPQIVLFPDLDDIEGVLLLLFQLISVLRRCDCSTLLLALASRRLHRSIRLRPPTVSSVSIARVKVIVSPDTVASLPTRWRESSHYRLHSVSNIRSRVAEFRHRNFDSWNRDEGSKYRTGCSSLSLQRILTSWMCCLISGNRLTNFM